MSVHGGPITCNSTVVPMDHSSHNCSVCQTICEWWHLLIDIQVMAGNPGNGRGRGEHVLQCFQALGPNLAPPTQSDEYEEEDSPVVQLWDTTIPKMLAHLNGVLPREATVSSLKKRWYFGGEMHEVGGSSCIS